MIAVEVERDKVREPTVELDQRRVGTLHAGELELDEVLAHRVALIGGRGGQLLYESGVVLGIKVEREDREG